MGSRRLPGKVMMPLAGRPIIWHIFDRLSRTIGVRGVILATTHDPRNDAMVHYAEDLGMTVFRAEVEDDIAARLAGAVRMTGAHAILKVNGDCPLIDPGILQHMVECYVSEPNVDYVSNKLVFRYPLGLSAEVVSQRALNWCDDNLSGAHAREYVADWIKAHPEPFRAVSVTGGQDLSHHDWSVDTPEDFSFVGRIFDALYQDGKIFGLADVLEFLADAPAFERPAAESAG